MTTTTKPAVSIEYKLEHVKGLSSPRRQLFRIVRWLANHDCNCEFCELPTKGEWVTLDQVDESMDDEVHGLDDAVGELFYNLNMEPPERRWRPVSDRSQPDDEED